MLKLTALIEKSEDGWYVGQVEEMPAAISQGKTIEEVKNNLSDAVKLLMITNRELVEKEYEGRTIMREDIFIVV
jgi:predicted RNase H-like HicB family nuclease